MSIMQSAWKLKISTFFDYSNYNNIKRPQKTLAASVDWAAIVFDVDRKGNPHKHREEEAGYVCHEQPE